MIPVICVFNEQNVPQTARREPCVAVDLFGHIPSGPLKIEGMHRP